MYKWLDNYWYHYKWTTIIVVSFAVILTICIVQMATKETYDITVLYTGPHIFIKEEKLSMQNALSSVLKEDNNNDGKKTVVIQDMPAFTPEQAEEAMKAAEEEGRTIIINSYSLEQVTQSFSQEVLAGESVICLLDRYWYDKLISNDGLTPLKEVVGKEVEGAFDDYGIYLKDTAFGKFFSAFDVLPDDTILCIRRVGIGSLVAGQKSAQKRYESSKRLFCEIINFEYPQGWTE